MSEMKYIHSAGRCGKCSRFAWRRSWDNLCIDCLVNDRDFYKTGSQESSELHNELVIAFAGIVGEKLIPCMSPCIGHFGPNGTALYRVGLDRYKEMIGSVPQA